MSNHTHLRSGHLYPATFGNNLKLPDLPSLPCPPAFSTFMIPPFPFSLFSNLILPLYSFSTRYLFPWLSLYLCYVLMGPITLPPFVITGMFTLFPLASSRYSALRKWKSVWALRSDSLRVLINPLGVRSDVEVSFLTKTMDLFFFLSEIDLEAHDHSYQSKEQQWALYALYCWPRGTTT